MGTLSDTVLATMGSRLTAVPGTKSVSLVGSLCDYGNPDAISDIDFVIIADRLTPDYYNACLAVARIDPGQIGFPDYTLVINPTLGPIKLNSPRTVVFHLMLYDMDSHREHVIHSPFTCFDWERSRLCAGTPLSAIYPVLQLQPRDFSDSRRGVGDYLDDLSRGEVSFRRYVQSGARMTQQKEWLQLDSRQQAEFAYHIIRNMVMNYLKCRLQQNRYFPDEEFDCLWTRHLPLSSVYLEPFRRLRTAKRTHQFDSFKDDVLKLAHNFIQSFTQEFTAKWTSAHRLIFVRHAITELNDGTFLGQRRDPPLSDQSVISSLPDPINACFCSPARRAHETALRLAPCQAPLIDSRLMEIDYGDAEGLTPSILRTRYPAISAEWAAGRDSAFPGGETTNEVLQRLKHFIKDVSTRSGTTLIVTHNVVMRCLAGWLYGIPMEKWHRIKVDHLAQFEVLALDGELYPNANRHVKTTITDGLAGCFSDPSSTPSTT